MNLVHLPESSHHRCQSLQILTPPNDNTPVSYLIHHSQ